MLSTNGVQTQSQTQPGGAMTNVRNALLVGGQKRCWEPIMKYLASCRVQIFAHWHEDRDSRKRIPKNIDIVIIIASQVSHALQNHAKAQAEGFGIPIAYTSHTFVNFPQQLKEKWGIAPVMDESEVQSDDLYEPEETEPLVPLDEMDPLPPVRPMPSRILSNERVIESPPKPVVFNSSSISEEGEPAAMPKKPMKKNQARASAKMDYLAEMIMKDPTANPNELAEKVIEKFGKGVAKPVIAKIRWDTVGLKFGPAGRIYDKSGTRRLDLENGGGEKSAKQKKPVVKASQQRHEEEASEPRALSNSNGHSTGLRVQRRPEANVESSNDRLRQLITEVRNLMSSQDVEQLVIHRDGPTRVRRTVEQEF